LSNSGDKRDEQLFCIQTVKTFTYKELLDDTDKCINIVKDIINKENLEYKVKDEEYTELKQYMLKFLIDIEREYKE